MTYQKTGKGLGDMGRSIASITGWSMLMANTHPVENKTPWGHNPLLRGIEEFQCNQSRFASSITTLASVIGLAGSHGSDLKQSIAETSYLMGDATMFFIEKGNVGSEAATNTESAAKVAAEFVCSSPILFSQTTQTEFVHHLSGYLAERIVEERLEGRHKKAPAETKEMIAEETAAIAKDMAKNMFKELAGKEKKSEKVANTIARISELFPEAQRAGVEHDLIHAIAGLPGVSIDEADIQQAVTGQRSRFTLPAEAPASPPSMATLSTMLAELTFQLPSLNAAANAQALFDSVSTHSRPHSRTGKTVRIQSYASGGSRYRHVPPYGGEFFSTAISGCESLMPLAQVGELVGDVSPLSEHSQIILQ